MPIYDRPTKTIMTEWATEHLAYGQQFDKSKPVSWFTKNFPNIKTNTVQMHVEGMSVNNPIRKHHPSIREGTGHDLFFKLGSNQFRLWDKDIDPDPKYKADFERRDDQYEEDVDNDQKSGDITQVGATSEFAFERDLQNYLVKNLKLIEPNLTLYVEEGLSGVEFPAGGRYIDILAVDEDSAFVVIELKVSRGHDRAIGQLLRYMGWIKKNMDTPKTVRGVIVANNITNDLKLAASLIPNVQLIEYEISFQLQHVAQEKI